jgi:hypothetical protein
MSDTETEPESQQERLTDLEHSKELNRMVARLWGLNTAIRGLDLDTSCPSDFLVSGVYRIADDVCESMEDCAAAFNEEWRLRVPSR